MIGQIGPGLLVFLGIAKGDGVDDLAWVCSRLTKLRLFEDGAGKINRAITEVDGDILLISQFTLFGNLKKGNRPSFNRSAPPQEAIPLYQQCLSMLAKELGKRVPSGQFGADMTVDAANDGPVTLILDSQQRDF